MSARSQRNVPVRRETFDQAAYKGRLASLLNDVSADQITIKFQSASVIVTAEITAASKSASDGVTQAIGS